MNGALLPQAVLGITLGLLAAGFIGSWVRPTSPGGRTLTCAGVLALLVYAVIAAPVFIRGGMTLLGLILLLVVVVLPLLALALRQRFPDDPVDPLARYARLVVQIGLLAVLLIAVGQTLSMLGLVDPRLVVVVVALLGTLLTVGASPDGSNRLAALAVWLMAVPVLIALALGIFLGEFSAVTDQLIEVDGPAPAAVITIAVIVFLIGWSDARLDLLRGRRLTSSGALIGALLVVGLIGLGLLMFLGGAVIAPSLQFFVIPANLDLIPGIPALILGVFTVVFVAMVTSVLSGVASPQVASARVETASVDSASAEVPGPAPADQLSPATQTSPAAQTSPVWAVVTAVAATVLALVDLGSSWMLAVTGLVAAAITGASLGGRGFGRGLRAGLIAAVVIVVAAAFLTRVDVRIEGGWWALLGIAVVAAIAALTARAGSRRPQAEPVQTSAGDR